MPPDDERDYEVGYAKPPEHTRFVKGQSGNPRGRAPGAKNRFIGDVEPAFGQQLLDIKLT